jgi:hypothetical protein
MIVIIRGIVLASLVIAALFILLSFLKSRRSFRSSIRDLLDDDD